jgi:hypothetical protein
VIRISTFLVGVLLGALSISNQLQAQEDKKSQAEAQRLEAQDAEMKQKFAAMKQRIEELRSAKKFDAAEAAERELQAMIKAVQAQQGKRFEAYVAEQHRKVSAEARDKIQAALQDAQQKLEELRKTGKQDEAERVEKFIQLLAEKLKGTYAADSERKETQPESGGAEKVEHQSQHLLQAAEHLAAAGLKEQAEQLRQQVEKMRAHAGEGHGPPHVRELHALIRQQNERIERLEQVVQKLVAHIEGEKSEKK